MKKNEIVVGGLYVAKVGTNITTVRVDAIREIEGRTSGSSYWAKTTPATTVYDVTNVKTGRKTTFRSAMKFRHVFVGGGRRLCKACGALTNFLDPHNRCGKCVDLADSLINSPNRPDKFLTDEGKRRREEEQEIADGTPETTKEEREADIDRELACKVAAKTLIVHDPDTAEGKKQQEDAIAFAKTIYDPPASDDQVIPPYVLPPYTPKAPTPTFAELYGAPNSGAARSSGFGARLTKSVPAHLLVEARAGTGKTFTIVVGIAWAFRDRVPQLWSKLVEKLGFDPQPSEQQQKVWDAMKLSSDAATVQMTAFNKSIVREFETKWGWLIAELRNVGISLQFATNHSMGFAAVRKSFGSSVRVDEHRVVNLLAKTLGMDVRQLMRDKFELVKVVEKLVSLVKMNMCGTDAEQLDELVAHYDIELDKYRTEAYELIPQILEACKQVRQDGCIDYDDMIWLPCALDLQISRNDLLLVDECQDLNRCQQELALKAGRRLILVGDTHQCFLPGTNVTVEGNAEVPIERLRVGMRVMTFNPNGGNFAGRRSQGRSVEYTSETDYDGAVIRIEAGDHVATCTTNHRWWTRLDPSCKTKFCLYLMEKAGQFRVGICQMQYQCGIGLSARARSEDADRSWLLQIFDSLIEARLAEELVAVNDGLPQLVFLNRGSALPSQDFIDAFYSELGCNRDRAEKCLTSYGRDINYPIWEKRSEREHNYLSVTKGFVTQACNLIDGCFQFRVDNGTKEGKWVTGQIGTQDYKGKVYGITVEPTERGLRLYVANGIVTHNSIYGFAGADAQSINRMLDRLTHTTQGCQVLPLTVTRRCGHAIVKEANAIVKDFAAHETNPAGVISSANYPVVEQHGRQVELPFEKTYLASAKSGDMVLCRVNGPLVSNCFRFLKRGIKANIQGRDIGAGLISTIKKLNAKDIPDLVGKIGDWLVKELAKEQAKRIPSEARQITLTDRADCLMAFTEAATTVSAVLDKIQTIFTDDRQGGGVRLSSIHRAKGLEAKRVFLLEPKGATVPHPMAKSSWQREQEMNLRYVAITRAIEHLTYVS